MQANSPSFFRLLLQKIQKLSSSEEEYDEDAIGRRMLDGNARPRRHERREERDERTDNACNVNDAIGDEETCASAQFAKWLVARHTRLAFRLTRSQCFLWIGEFDLKIVISYKYKGFFPFAKSRKKPLLKTQIARFLQ
jgi:hypothetical protein